MAVGLQSLPPRGTSHTLLSLVRCERNTNAPEVQRDGEVPLPDGVVNEDSRPACVMQHSQCGWLLTSLTSSPQPGISGDI
ncbi:hypothetical protein EYF80_039501 [Liparis tanakae]|uniref:Uncharacterized protein n=1 Tax=Liparis tanakae TaxID=230148 RepID=A0A4Z2G9P6_9TELE|nr:hypothetical protein EYF80_039501 [Liparis tanakae]